MDMSYRRLALAPLVAIAFTGLVGGPAASAAPSSTSDATATTAAKKQSTSKKNASSKKKSTKKKAKKPTVASLDKRLRKTEKDLVAARKQLRTVQQATATMVTGLDTITGASGSIEALIGGGVTAAIGPEITKLEAILASSLAANAEQNANAAITALANPALKPQLEQLLTGVFGVAPATIGQSVANLGPAVQEGLKALVVREQPVVFVRVGGTSSSAVVGADLPDDANPLTVSGSVVLDTSGGTPKNIELLAGARSDEGDSPAATVVLDSIEAEGTVGVTVGGGGDTFGGTRAIAGSGAAVNVNRIERNSALSPADSKLVNIAQGPLTVSGNGKVLVRFTVRFTDTSLND